MSRLCQVSGSPRPEGCDDCPVNLRGLHGTLAALTAAAGLALVLSGGWAAWRRSAPAIRVVLLVRRVALGAAVLAVLAGAILFATGARPRAPLHYLYAVLVAVSVPLATTLAARRPQSGGWYHLGAGVLLLLFGFRLLATG